MNFSVNNFLEKYKNLNYASLWCLFLLLFTIRSVYQKKKIF